MVHFYDPVVDAWNPGLTQPICICNGRHHPSLKMAPTGEVLVINGDSLTHDPEIRRVVYIDPMNGFTVTKGKNTVIEERGYHNVAVLLPDGRFLVGSGAPGFLPGQERPTFRYYSPWYRQGQPQPVIQSAPSVIRYAQKFLIGFVSTAPTPVQAVLIAPTALTHSFDANQRYVELAVTVNPTGRITAVAPPDERVGPPGEYLLFLVDANRIPSVARWVRLR
jgi:hypothetical protein